MLLSNDPSSPVLCQSKGVVENVLAEFALEVADQVLDIGQFGLRLVRDLDKIQLRIDIA